MEQESLRSLLNRKGTANESVNNSFSAINNDIANQIAEIPQTGLSLAEEDGRDTANWSRSCKDE